MVMVKGSVQSDPLKRATSIGTNTPGKTVQIGDATSTAVNIDASAITIDSVDALSMTANEGGASLAFDASGATTLATVAYDHNATGAVTIDASGTNAISIGSDTNTGIINVGNSNSARTINVGHTASTAVNVNALAATITSVNALSVTDGSANLAFNGTGATTLTTVAYDHNATGAVTIDASSSNAISIGATSATGQVNLGTAGARTITMGNTTALTKVVLNSASYDVSNPANGGITTIGNIHLDTGVENRRPGSPPPRPSATIVTFTNNDGTDLSSSAGLAVKASGEMGCELAVTTDDNIIGILSKGDEDGESVQVQIGGIMLAKFTGANTAGNLASIHGSNGTLVDMSQSTLTDAADARFITVRSGDSGTNNSLVMWLKGESF